MNKDNFSGEVIDIENSQTTQSKESFFKDIVKFALLALVIVVPIRMYIASPFIVSGASMDPSFETGHYLIVDQISYRFSDPQRGEVIIFHYPKDPSKFFIKRIIGLPGEKIIISDENIIIENKDFPEGIILNEPYVTHQKIDTLEFELKENEYFVMGDNRAESSDSRIWGPLPYDMIVGKAFLRLLPASKVDILPEQARY